MKKRMRGDYIAIISLCALLIYIYINTTLENKNLKKEGIEVTAIVLTHRKELEYVRGSAKRWYSRAYYKVEGKDFSRRIPAIIPIGAKVKIRYAPRNPNYSELVDPHEFDNYPKEP